MPKMDLTNKEAVDRLVQSCIKGDRKSQQFLYQTFYGKMMVVCLRYASNHEEAQDILHDGFLKVFDKLKSFQNKGSFEGWIRRIIVNNAIDFLRKRRDYLLSFDDSGFENLKDEDQDSVGFEEDLQMKAELILKLIQKLTPAYRTVFNMYVIEEYSHKDIAEILGISIGSSKSNLAKAKMKLKEYYKESINEFERE